jgi:hypothetical protein
MAEHASPIYFQSSEVTPPVASSVDAQPGPFDWSRVDPRFHITVDELSGDIGDWVRTGGGAADDTPVLTGLADALDAMPRVDGMRAEATADTIRSIAEAIRHDPLDDAGRRRATRDALVIAARQMTVDARATYAADPNVARTVGELRVAALAISDAGPDAAVERGLLAAHDAIHAFEIAIARGAVAIPSD